MQLTYEHPHHAAERARAVGMASHPSNCWAHPVPALECLLTIASDPRCQTTHKHQPQPRPLSLSAVTDVCQKDPSPTTSHASANSTRVMRPLRRQQPTCDAPLPACACCDTQAPSWLCMLWCKPKRCRGRTPPPSSGASSTIVCHSAVCTLPKNMGGKAIVIASSGDTYR